MAKMLIPPHEPTLSSHGWKKLAAVHFLLAFGRALLPLPGTPLGWGTEDSKVVAADFLVLRLGGLDLCTINLTQEKESFLEMILLIKKIIKFSLVIVNHLKLRVHALRKAALEMNTCGYSKNWLPRVWGWQRDSFLLYISLEQLDFVHIHLLTCSKRIVT